MKRDLRWPIGIALLLTVFVVANLLVMRMAGADPSFAVEPDYYQKAVDFDSTMADERRSAALGWVATSSIAADDSGSTLVVALVDARGAAVSGATVTATARFVARANEVSNATLRELQGGRYEARMNARHLGIWEVRVLAKRGSDRFTATTRADARAVR